MQDIVLYSHLVIGILFIISVLVQDKGVGFGTAVGGAGGGGIYTSQRGAAKILHRASVLLAVLFLGTALAYVAVPASEEPADGTPGVESSVTAPDVSVDSSPVIDGNEEQ